MDDLIDTTWTQHKSEYEASTAAASMKAVPSAVAFELEQTDAEFPVRLLHLERMPLCLYGRGEAAVLEDAGIAIIGARNATPYGIRVAEMIAGWAADAGLVVYSGCARGCDQAAHRAALAAGGKTVAVMGCGADVAYPRRAHALLDCIATQGCVLSQYPWGTPPDKFRFRERNRLIAALSILVIVVEARIPSGTFSTVEHAVQLGTALAAVPGSLFSPESAAPNRLITEGAIPITTREDLLQACALNVAWYRLPKEPMTISTLSSDDNEAYKKHPTNTSVIKAEGAESSSAQDRLLHALRASPASIDEAAHDLEMAASEVISLCNRLEFEGRIERFPDGRYGCVSYPETVIPRV